MKKVVEEISDLQEELQHHNYADEAIKGNLKDRTKSDSERRIVRIKEVSQLPRFKTLVKNLHPKQIYNLCNLKNTNNYNNEHRKDMQIIFNQIHYKQQKQILKNVSKEHIILLVYLVNIFLSSVYFI